MTRDVDIPHSEGGDDVVTHQKTNPDGKRKACGDYELCCETYMNDVVNLDTVSKPRDLRKGRT